MYAYRIQPSDAPTQPTRRLRAARVGERSSEYGGRFARYESEGSEQRSLGSMAVASGARWLATLTVPITAGRVAFFHLERRGSLPPGYLGSEEESAFSVPLDEVDSVLAILNGIVAQAKKDHVLPSRG